MARNPGTYTILQQNPARKNIPLEDMSPFLHLRGHLAGEFGD